MFMQQRPTPIPPQPGQESVWAYPRPARLEPTTKRIQVICNGVTIADTQQAYRVLETSHPPTYYIPPSDLHQVQFVPLPRKTICEWKGECTYYTLIVGDRQISPGAWSYTRPTPDFLPMLDYIAFYAGPMDACYVDGEQVTPQAGGFYGGWITSDVVGPFKGGPGTWGW
jgi:uncharacterized protein (DUF427 family)